ncbi:hypothetical protein [Klebsiella quasipneumoniae]|uniref:hypothetical protein n=1 Tax=Klebsiella quasipneumoniae TaxID=1463165 RepID=UPI003B9DFC0D
MTVKLTRQELFLCSKHLLKTLSFIFIQHRNSEGDMSDAISSQLENIITMLIAISIASERVVEIIKGYFPWLNLEKQDPVREGKRKSALQLLAVGAGIVTAFLTQPFVAGSFSAFKHPDLMTLCIGLMASGGSAFWNAILNYLLQVKNLKKLQVNSVKADTVVDPLPPSPVYQDMVPGAEPVSSNPCFNPEGK